VTSARIDQEPDQGQERPFITVRPPGPATRALLARAQAVAAPMGPRPSGDPTSRPALVMASGRGSNLVDVDGNRYVDFAAGFGALLLGHSYPRLVAALNEQSLRLQQALGDVYPSDVKIELMERLTRLYPGPARAILAQSGSDAVSAALKSALLYTGRPGVVAFAGAYHGLGYGPLAACGLRASYREPFREQLNQSVRFAPYPASERELAPALASVRSELARGDVGAILVEPILGRGGVLVPPTEFLPELARASRDAGAVLIADEVWTGLGRSGKMLYSLSDTQPDLLCLGKGLGGGTPLSALIGRQEILAAWQRDEEVVHTATFAGAPLACRVGLELLQTLEDEGWVERASSLGARFRATLGARLAAKGLAMTIRGEGLMLGIDCGGASGAGAKLQALLLERGYITSTGGGSREVLVLTPPLNIGATLVDEFTEALLDAVAECRST
jgi:4-aminobutyrate aminotransferase/(S)-3-amino-2-methylpropionate transaminase